MKTKDATIPADNFYSLVMLLCEEKLGTKMVREWEKLEWDPKRRVELERKYMADQDNAVECAMRVGWSIAGIFGYGEA